MFYLFVFNTSFKTDDAKQSFHLKVVENLNHNDEKLLYAIAKLIHDEGQIKATCSHLC